MEIAKTRQQIADEYGISRKTLSRWLKKADIDLEGYLISPKEQALIYETFGDPQKKRSASPDVPKCPKMSQFGSICPKIVFGKVVNFRI